MSGLKIEDAPRDENVTGGELVPVSDGGVARAVSIGDIKDFALKKIAEATGITAFGDGDRTFVVRESTVYTSPVDLLAAKIWDFAFGMVGVVEPNGNEKFAVSDAGVRKTITLEAVKSWLEDHLDIEADVDFSKISQAGELEGSDLALVCQASGNGKVALTTLKDFVLKKFADFVKSLSQVETTSKDDFLYVVRGSEAKKIKVSQILSMFGSGYVKAPSKTTEDNIPQWDSGASALKDGKAVTNTVNKDSTSDQVPTAAAVFAAIQGAAAVSRDTSSTPKAGNIPTWTNDHAIGSGKEVATEVRDSGTATDSRVPTEKAVRDALAANPADGKTLSTSIPSTGASDSRIPTEKAVADKFANGVVAPPISHSENAIPVWGPANELRAGKSLVTVLPDAATDDQVPTAKAVRDAIPGIATPTTDGVMSAADKAKLDGLVDTGAVAEIGADLDDADTFVVKDNDQVHKKSLLSRLWTYIRGKLNSYPIDALTEARDTADLDSSTARHGLLRKLSGNTNDFLRGDGSWAEPSGNSEFSGDSGSGGSKGLVPAPAAGDAAENKFLNANGKWSVTPAAAGVDIHGAAPIDSLSSADELYVFDESGSVYRKATMEQVDAYVRGRGVYDTVFVPAGAMVPSKDAGATMGAVQFTDAIHDTAAFSKSVSQGAEFSVVLPTDWDLGALKFKVLWTAYDVAAETGEAVSFGLGVVSAGDGDSISTKPVDFANVEDVVQSPSEMHRTPASAAIVPFGQYGAGNLLHFKLVRNMPVTNGSPMDAEALVLGVVIQFRRILDVTGW